MTPHSLIEFPSSCPAFLNTTTSVALRPLVPYGNALKRAMMSRASGFCKRSCSSVQAREGGTATLTSSRPYRRSRVSARALSRSHGLPRRRSTSSSSLAVSSYPASSHSKGSSLLLVSLRLPPASTRPYPPSKTSTVNGSPVPPRSQSLSLARPDVLFIHRTWPVLSPSVQHPICSVPPARVVQSSSHVACANSPGRARRGVR